MSEKDQTKIKRLFSFIKELHNIKTPPVSEIGDYEWRLELESLPIFSTIKTFKELSSDNPTTSGVVIRVARPNETQCPPPPDILDEWISSQWNGLSREVEFHKFRNIVENDLILKTEEFSEVPERLLAQKDWLESRMKWLEAEIPLRNALKVFNHLFELHSKLKKEDEKYQLYFTDGHLSWESEKGNIFHPILMQKAHLEFDPDTPSFTIIIEEDETIKLATNLLRYHGISGKSISDLKSILETEAYSLVEPKNISEVFNRFIHSAFRDGKVVELNDPEIKITSKPTIHSSPTIILTKKSHNFAEVLEKIIENTSIDQAQPVVLQRIVGLSSEHPSEAVQWETNSPLRQADSAFEFFQTKPANEEQIRIVKRLEKNGNVLVQGPPGTGKSHTIANLVGHLLAKGKTVLVTSHTSKALNVVREKVAKPLQPLCVSSLSNEVESKAQLKDSINGIVNFLSKTDTNKIQKEILELKSKREALIKDCRALEEQSLKIRMSEYEEIRIPGETPLSPSEAAKYIQKHREKESWIPGQTSKGTPCPLSLDDLKKLYETNTLISNEEERCLEESILDISLLPTPSEFGEISQLYKELATNIESKHLKYFKSNSEINEFFLEEFTRKMSSALKKITREKWSINLYGEINLDHERAEPWTDLTIFIEQTYKNIVKNENVLIRENPKVAFQWNDQIYQSLLELIGHISQKGNISWTSTLFRKDWKNIIEGSEIDGRKPRSREDFQIISLIYENTVLRKRLLDRWNRQMVPLGADELEVSKPEVKARAYIEQIEHNISWSTHNWDKSIQYFDEIGFDVHSALEDQNLDFRTSGHAKLQFLETKLIPSLTHKYNQIKIKRIETKILSLLNEIKIKTFSENTFSYYLQDINIALETQNLPQYRSAYERLQRLNGLLEIYSVRAALLAKLEKYAEEWAKHIRFRIKPHDGGNLPGNPTTAWNLLQYKQELDDRQKEDYYETQRKLDFTKNKLEYVNAKYVEALAWSYQLARTSLEQQQALKGWQQLQEKITKTGRGKLDARRRNESRGLLKKCKDSVPVWIMPLSKVYESFDFSEPAFDVLILDEASQSDVTAIVALGIADEVVVVGDKEQVTPQGIGQELNQVQTLIDEFLSDIPNKMLYDGRTSIYDIADQSFGEVIRLVEHFRCLPDIINFSNFLSYNGEIKPLREQESGKFKKSLIEHKVPGKRSSSGDTNQIEAEEIASIVISMTLNPNYSNLSIGVISLLGSQQAIKIDTILRANLEPAIYEKHNILCGDAANFQGDERDIILLSVVESCDSPPLRILQAEDAKKRYNVAASRARDQLWVVHSLNPETDLKSNDLRFKLISHVRNPSSVLQNIEEARKHADSDFEIRVQKDLIVRGYKIYPQWQVGSFRIDIVVKSGEKRIAIECDGDRYHTSENLMDDINRQGILERLGWKFIRIRGSEYYRNPSATIERVLLTLQDHEIFPEHSDLSTSIKDDDEILRSIHLEAKLIRQRWNESRDGAESTTDIEIEDTPSNSNTTVMQNKRASEPFGTAVRDISGHSKHSQPPQKSNLIDTQAAKKLSSRETSKMEEIKKKYTDPDHYIPADEDLYQQKISSQIEHLNIKLASSSMDSLLTVEAAISKIIAPGHDCWFEICKIKELLPYQRSQAYNIGNFLKTGRTLSEKLAYSGVKIVNELVSSGIRSETWSLSTFSLKKDEMMLFLEVYNPNDLK